MTTREPTCMYMCPGIVPDGTFGVYAAPLTEQDMRRIIHEVLEEYEAFKALKKQKRARRARRSR